MFSKAVWIGFAGGYVCIDCDADAGDVLRSTPSIFREEGAHKRDIAFRKRVRIGYKAFPCPPGDDFNEASSNMVYEKRMVDCARFVRRTCWHEDFGLACKAFAQMACECVYAFARHDGTHPASSLSDMAQHVLDNRLEIRSFGKVVIGFRLDWGDGMRTDVVDDLCEEVFLAPVMGIKRAPSDVRFVEDVLYGNLCVFLAFKQRVKRRMHCAFCLRYPSIHSVPFLWAVPERFSEYVQ